MPKKAAACTAAPQVNDTADQAAWPRVTREVAEDLAVDAIARDRAGKPPFDELSRLREAGLPALLMPPGSPQWGTDWRTACAVIREIAAADSSIGELLGRHYALSWSARFFGSPEQADRIERQAGAGQWLWGGSIELPGTEPEQETETGPELTLTPAGSGYLLHGRQVFPAGVTVADQLVVSAVCTSTGETLIAQVDPADPRVSAVPAHDRLGQRLTGAGSVDFDGVPVQPDHILGTVPHDEHDVSPFATLAPMALRLALVHVCLGIAEGTLAEARDFSRTAPRNWPSSDPDGGAFERRPGSDPYLLLAYGELVAAAHTAAAVVEPATEALARGLLMGRELDVDQRADIAVLVAAAEAVTSRSTLEITTRVLELTDGADSPADGPGFDRFWRNARVLTAQGSPTHRLRDIGDHYLNGTHPPLTLHI
ncbi:MULTISPECIES: acyl-CoA dehydrogenase family protein [Streptomyces]|uniref:Acyl-CoA dehydrogenase family protein n=1 Tax=Streptomyces siderophoricus TaxID=2802281 RepID=A0ABS1MQ33_9ACTN|nr:acyl-CoA dehydrogenase family protein [Streptomyces sp. 9-7]MBL1089893.1 acyl-CoA dehydrogenase family protein [Streptomyces sp. 9-7]